MPSRLETLRDILMAAVRLGVASGAYPEPVDVKSTWFLAEDYEDSFAPDGQPVGTVWLTPRPATLRTEARNGTVTEEITMHMTLFFPIDGEGAIGQHVQLAEVLLDTLRNTALANHYLMTLAQPALDETGTPYLFTAMERRAFFTAYEIHFTHIID